MKSNLGSNVLIKQAAPQSKYLLMSIKSGAGVKSYDTYMSSAQNMSWIIHPPEHNAFLSEFVKRLMLNSQIIQKKLRLSLVSSTEIEIAFITFNLFGVYDYTNWFQPQNIIDARPWNAQM